MLLEIGTPKLEIQIFNSFLLLSSTYLGIQVLSFPTQQQREAMDNGWDPFTSMYYLLLTTGPTLDSKPYTSMLMDTKVTAHGSQQRVWYPFCPDRIHKSLTTWFQSAYAIRSTIHSCRAGIIFRHHNQSQRLY